MSNRLHANPLIGQPAVGARVRRSMAAAYAGDWSATKAGHGCELTTFAKVHGQRPRGGSS